MYIAHLASGPNSSPCKHSLTSVLDFSFSQELFLGEHAWEGIESFTFSEGKETHRIPNSFSGLQGTGGSSGLLRDKGRAASQKGGKKSDGELGHGGIVWVWS